ncbi:MAG: NAD(P)H-binding protein [Bacteroidota bacterium]|jgi:putative NADH-flavin reductase
MQQNTTIAVIGGTGKSGKYLVNQLLQRGFRLKVLLRNPEKFIPKNTLIQIINGDVKDYDSVLSLVKDCHAVISTLGLGQPASEMSIFSQATTNIIRAMNEYDIQRYVVITGLNVDTPFDKKSPKTQFATDWMYENYPKTTADKQLEYHILSESNVNWTLVRLPLIEQTEEKSETKTSLKDCLGDKISATSLADFLIEQLSDETFIKQAPFIANS